MSNVKVLEGCTPSRHSCLLQLRELQAALGMWPHHPGSASVVTWPLPSVSHLPLPLVYEDTWHWIRAYLDNQGWSSISPP